jgi:catechol 2,3-dioxygenase-like lactoylglutathione lyase family enzyme
MPSTRPLIEPRGLSHLVIRVPDVGRSSDWYERVFGYRLFIDERTKEPSPRTMGIIGDTALEIVKAGKTGADPDGAGYALMSFAVDDVEKTITALHDAGVAKAEPPVAIGAIKYALFRDPDGILLEIIELGEDASLAAFGNRILARRAEKAAKGAA